MSDDQILLKMTGLNRTFDVGGVETTALKGINLEIKKGDYVSISGPSGCGKSTLLNIIGLLDKHSSGNYSICDIDISGLPNDKLATIRNREIGFIFQDFNLIGDMSVFENVELPLIYRGIKKSERESMVMECLERVNMTNRAQHMPGQLSGGQQQRVAVARAIVGKPSVLLADEPTGNLDSDNGDAVMQLLEELNNSGVTICMVTHDSRYADYAKRVINLFDGEIVDGQQENRAEVA